MPLQVYYLASDLLVVRLDCIVGLIKDFARDVLERSRALLKLSRLLSWREPLFQLLAWQRRGRVGTSSGLGALFLMGKGGGGGGV